MTRKPDNFWNIADNSEGVNLQSMNYGHACAVIWR